MTPETKAFLQQFGDWHGATPAVASYNVFALTDDDGKIVVKSPAVTAIVLESYRAGLLRRMDDRPSASIYGVDFGLTESGREAVGLPPLVAPAPVVAKPKKAAKPVKPKAPSLFGDDDE